MRITLFPMLLVAVLLCAPAAAAPVLQIGPTGSEMMTEAGVPVMGVMESWDPITGMWSGTWSTAMWDASWNLVLDPDPGISGVIGLTNNGAMMQAMTFNVSMATIGFYPTGSFMTGSSAITVTDANFNSTATMSTQTGVAIYTALIDGTQLIPSGELFPDAYSLTATGLGAANSANSSFTSTTPMHLASSMGINHLFNLTPGDNATVNSTFYVIPEPMTISLLGLGGLALLKRRR